MPIDILRGRPSGCGAVNEDGVAVAVAIGRGVPIGVERTGVLVGRVDVIAVKPIVPAIAIKISQPICEGEAVDFDPRLVA
jgi:hypothetical protein